MANIFARIRRPALRQGLIFGLILGVVQIVLSLVPRFLSNIGEIIIYVILALFAIFSYIAGQKAAQETGKLSSGTLAGLLAGVIGFVLVAIVTLIQVAIFLQEYVNLYTTHPAPGVNPATYTPAFVFANFVLVQVEGLIFYALVSIVGGTVGGMLGRGRALATYADEEYEETVFEPPARERNSKAADAVEFTE